jgi:hypothetical protein
MSLKRNKYIAQKVIMLERLSFVQNSRKLLSENRNITVVSVI